MSGQAPFGNNWQQDGWEWSQPGAANQWEYNNQQYDNQPRPTNVQQPSYYRPEDMVLDADQLTFQQDNYEQNAATQNYQEQYAAKMSFFYDQPQGYMQPAENLKPPPSATNVHSTNFDDEPPLLEELGIFPEQIAERVLVVLDPFHSSVPLGEYDLGGPLVFCLILGVTMLISGGKVNFGYVYGIGTTGCLLMYCLLNLMIQTGSITFVCVASVLGYCLLPVVILSLLGIIFVLKNIIGYVLAGIVIFWASIAASRIFVTMSSDVSQRALIVYPCVLLYGVFTLLVVF